jgi:hypothetical protein
MHLTVDHALRNDIVIGIASCTRLTSGVSQIKNVVPSVGYTGFLPPRSRSKPPHPASDVKGQ